MKITKDKTMFFVLIGAGIIIIALIIGIFLIIGNKQTVNPPKNNEQTQSALLETESFSMNLPTGWQKVDPLVGISAMAVNIGEKVTDPTVQKINFKTYAAISYNTLQGKKMSEYLKALKNELLGIVPDVVFTKEQDIKLNNGYPANTIEAEFNQQGVDFKVLIVTITGPGEDVWMLSFNTTKSSWDGYKQTFLDMANSFTLKQK
jgi:hypothetical protein